MRLGIAVRATTVLLVTVTSALAQQPQLPSYWANQPSAGGTLSDVAPPSAGAPQPSTAAPQPQASPGDMQQAIDSQVACSQPCVTCPCPRCHCVSCECPEKAQPCDPCPRVNNLNPAWALKLGGAATLDMLYNSARPVAPGTPFFLAPEGLFEDDTFDIHARQTTLYLAAQGPRIGDFQAGGLIMLALYNDSITVDRYGILPFQAFGDLKNESWRIAGGLQMDIFAPILPTVLPFSFLAASGNTGIYRGQLRVERFYHLAADEQITLTAGISDANPTILNNDVLTEDNGLPNFEARAAWAVGDLKQEGLVPMRPFEVGISGVVGQMRSTQIAVTQVVADVWGLAGDWRWRVNEIWGVAGEIFTGQALGTYGGGVLQNVNSATFEAIQTTGGWAEIYFYCNPCLHTHWGYGIDDPLDGDLALGQIALNETFYANLIYDVTKSLRLGFELTLRDTHYVLLPDNDGIGLHGQMQWKF